MESVGIITRCISVVHSSVAVNANSTVLMLTTTSEWMEDDSRLFILFLTVNDDHVEYVYPHLESSFINAIHFLWTSTGMSLEVKCCVITRIWGSTSSHFGLHDFDCSKCPRTTTLKMTFGITNLLRKRENKNRLLFPKQWPKEEVNKEEQTRDLLHPLLLHLLWTRSI